MAGNFLDQMSRIYRYILKNRDSETVSLAEEIKFVTHYIQLQQTRFKKGLEISITIDEEYNHRKIAPVILQNLVENAIKHNILSVDSPLVIDLFCEGEYVVVQNNLQRKGFVETSNKQGLVNMQTLYNYLTSQPIIIIEDQHKFIVKIPFARVLQDKIKAVADDITVLDVLPSLKTARKWFLQNAEPDLIFMDIQLSDGVSFEIFNQYTINCPVIFTTAYDEYAIRAFKVNGVDYLLKPVQDEELKQAVDKCRTVIQGRNKSNPGIQQLIQSLTNPQQQLTYKERFIVNVRNQWMPVNTPDIACFAKEALNYIYLLNGEKYITDYSSLEEIEELLDPRKFYRANRQYIINIDAVQSVKPVDNSKLIIRLKEPLSRMEIDMSRLKAPDFKKWLDH